MVMGRKMLQSWCESSWEKATSFDYIHIKATIMEFVEFLGDTRPILIVYDGHASHVDSKLIETAQAESPKINLGKEVSALETSPPWPQNIEETLFYFVG